MAAKKPIWPPTMSPVLSAFRDAMDRRSKALRHKLFDWTVERFEPEDGHGASWLVGMNTYRTEFRLRLWDRGEFWFYARELIGQDWRFEFEFRASIDSIEPDKLIEDIEATFLIVDGRRSNSDAKDTILQRWSRYGPYGIDRGRA